MPTGLLRVKTGAARRYDAWAIGAGASKKVAVDSLNPVTHDDDTTYIKDDTGGAQSIEVFLAGPAIKVLSIGAVRTAARWKRATGLPPATYFFHIGGCFAAGATTFSHTIDGSTGTGSYITAAPATLARPTGGSWVPADISGSLQVYVDDPASTGEWRVTTMWGEVDYLPYSSVMIEQLWYMGAILSCGAGLIYREAVELGKLLEPALGRFGEHDNRMLWDELRAYAWPHSICLGA
jgi:hypothetical protein